MKEFDYLVFIGRFQPLHNGHITVIREALRLAEEVIICVGSSNLARSPKNPFDFEERVEMIYKTFQSEIPRIIVAPIEDHPNDTVWAGNVQRAVNNNVWPDAKIGLIGYAKDHSSYYLKLFPQWKAVNVETQHSTLSSTDIRNEFLKPYFRLPTESHTSHSVVQFMEGFTETDEFKWLVKEHETNTKYNPRIYDNDIVCCVDNVVVQSGHVLLVTRDKHPGEGLLALPGGHVDKRERFQDAALRELREETHISDGKGELPPAMLASFIKRKEFIDTPERSLRARVVTMAYYYELPNRTSLYQVRGDDDARFAKWYELGKLDPTQFFEDHYFIIKGFTG